VSACLRAVTAEYRGNGVRLYDGHRGNSGDGDSIHGSTAVAVTVLTVDADERAVLKLFYIIFIHHKVAIKKKK